MSAEKYCISEFSEDHLMHHFKPKVKFILQVTNEFVHIYSNYHSVPSFGTEMQPKLFGIASEYTGCLQNLNKIKFIVTCKEYLLRSLQHERASNRPEASNSSTPEKINTNVTNLQAKRSLFPYEGDELRQSVIKSPEKAATVKCVEKAKDIHKAYESKPGYSKKISPSSNSFMITYPVQAVKQKSPKGMHSYGYESKPGGSKEISPLSKTSKNSSPNAEKKQKSPKDMLFDEYESKPGCSKEMTPSAIPKKTRSPIASNKRKLSKDMHSDGCEAKPSSSKEISPLPKGNITPSPPVPVLKQKSPKDKRFDRYESHPGCSKEISPLSKGNVTTSPPVPSNKQKSPKGIFLNRYESKPGGSKEMSPSSKTSKNSSPNAEKKQKSPKDMLFDEYESKPGCSKEMTPSAIPKKTRSPIASNKRKLSKDMHSDGCEAKPSSSKEITPLPKGNITTSPPVPVLKQKSPKDKRFDRYESHPGCSKEMSPSSKTSKSSSPNAANKQKLPKDMRSDRYESKPECSKEVTLLSKGNKNSSSQEAASRSSPITDCHINLLKTWFSYCSPINLSSFPSPKPHHLDTSVSKFCLMQFKTLLSKREDYLKQIHDGLMPFRYQLERLCHYLEVATYILITVSVVRADYVTIDIQKRILGLLNIASKLLKALVPLKMDVAVDFQNFIIYMEEVGNISSKHLPILSDGNFSLCIVFLQLYEIEMKIKWQIMDEIINNVGAKISQLLNTENDFKEFISLFIPFLAKVGLIKESDSPPTL